MNAAEIESTYCQQNYSRLLTVAALEETAQKANFRVDELARLNGVSTRTIDRHFRKYHAISAGEWLLDYRMRQARFRIWQGQKIVKIAVDLKFKRLSHFSRVFKTYFGVSPRLLQTQLYPPPAPKKSGKQSVFPFYSESTKLSEQSVLPRPNESASKLPRPLSCTSRDERPRMPRRSTLKRPRGAAPDQGSS